MKYFFSAMIYLWSFQPVFSQELIVDSGVVLKKGVYRTFEEFRSNRPSAIYSGDIVNKDINYGLFGYGGSIKYYGIEGAIEGDIKTNKLYGFSDGESVYLNTNFSLLSKLNFVKLGNLGRYCYIAQVVDGSVYVSPGMNGGLSASQGAKSRWEGILDINDGKKYGVSKEMEKTLFSLNDSLSKELKERSQINSSYKELLIRYSEIHQDEIKRGLTDKTRLDQLLYRNFSDSTLEAYENRVLSYLNEPMVVEIKVIKNYYKNDQLKVFGVWASHKMGNNSDYLYDVGTWYHYHKNGQLAEEINYNLNGKKHGLYSKYNENGVVIEELLYKNGEIDN